MGDADLVIASFRAWAPFFECIEGCRVDTVGDVLRWRSDIPLPFFNGAFGLPDEGRVDEILEPFDTRPVLWAGPADDAFEAALEERGFEVDRPPGMVVRLGELPPVVDLEGVEVRVVDDDHDALMAATTISLTTNGFPESAATPFVAAVERFGDRDSMRTFLATVDGEPAAASVLSTMGGSAGLYNVGTLDGFRGRGLGRLVSLAALHAGRAAGHDVGTLMASELGEPIYRAIGFQDAGRFVFAVRA